MVPIARPPPDYHTNNEITLFLAIALLHSGHLVRVANDCVRHGVQKTCPQLVDIGRRTSGFSMQMAHVIDCAMALAGDGAASLRFRASLAVVQTTSSIVGRVVSHRFTMGGPGISLTNMTSSSSAWAAAAGAEAGAATGAAAAASAATVAAAVTAAMVVIAVFVVVAADARRCRAWVETVLRTMAAALRFPASALVVLVTTVVVVVVVGWLRVLDRCGGIIGLPAMVEAGGALGFGIGCFGFGMGESWISM